MAVCKRLNPSMTNRKARLDRAFTNAQKNSLALCQRTADAFQLEQAGWNLIQKEESRNACLTQDAFGEAGGESRSAKRRR